ncbi:lmo0937 family membrane protein [Methylomonas sp. BW4-1]
MLETIAILFIILWALGLVSAYTLGGFIHLLLVIALIAIVLRVIQGRRAL